MTRADRLIIGAFASLQTLWVLLRLTGPFTDEGIYAAAGLAFDRGSTSDFSWLAGSLYLFPVVSGQAFKLLGLAGCRLVAVASCTLALVYFRQFASCLVGPKATTWALLGMSTNGMFFSLSHLAVYDCFALLGLCGAAGLAGTPSWSGRTTVLVAAFATFALLSKYTSIVPLGALAGVLLIHHRGRNRKHVLSSILLCVCLSGLLFRLTTGVWFPQKAIFAFEKQTVYERSSVLFDWLYFAGVPTLLASLSLILARSHSYLIRLSLLGAACAWPILHVIFGSRVSLNKHVVFASVFLYPFLGLLLQRAWERSKNVVGALVLVLLVVGFSQSYIQDRTWVDTRPAAQSLLAQLRPGETVAFEWGWALAPYLYGSGSVDSLSSIVDLIEGKRQNRRDLCNLTYIVSYLGSGTDSLFFPRATRRCGFVVAYDYPVQFWALRRGVPHTYDGRIVIYRNDSTSGGGYVER